MSQENKSPELDEAVWQAWLKKNKADEKLGLVKRLRVAGFLDADSYGGCTLVAIHRLGARVLTVVQW